VDFVIFATNKISLSTFWLEIRWDVVRHPNIPFLKLWCGMWVPTVRNVA